MDILIGKTLSECEDVIKSNRIVSNGWCSLFKSSSLFMIFAGTEITRIRPIIIDGEDMMVTMDHRLDRLNVELAGGKVVKIIKTG